MHESSEHLCTCDVQENMHIRLYLHFTRLVNVDKSHVLGIRSIKKSRVDVCHTDRQRCADSRHRRQDTD
jgi:hypothetical protein